VVHNQAAPRLVELPRSLESLTQLRHLYLGGNALTALPEWILNLTELQTLDLRGNALTELPQELGRLTSLSLLDVGANNLSELPLSIADLPSLTLLNLHGNANLGIAQELSGPTALRAVFFGPRGARSKIPLGEMPPWIRTLQGLDRLHYVGLGLEVLPDWIGDLSQLQTLSLEGNRLTDLPPSFLKLQLLRGLELKGNPLNPELEAASKQGLEAIKRYLRAKADAHVVLNEAKLILVGEGEVGKSSLLAALRGDPWIEGRPTTHGIEIKPIQVEDPSDGKTIVLNGWDFGGQRVYRPTHQLFFSSPALYLVVWKPREGSQQGSINEWIKLIKHRAPEARILVVASHGGPRERLPDIDRQELWDLFGRELIVDFFVAESRPDPATGERPGIAALKEAIARVAAGLPGMGRAVPERWEVARGDLRKSGAAYLPVEDVLEVCEARKMVGDEAKDFLRISHQLGHLIHYEHDPALRDIVILKPDWLSAAISFVLDDRQTRDAHGLVSFERLARLWDDPERPDESRYDAGLHPLFLRLMERFDLSYKVAIPSEPENAIGFWQKVGQKVGGKKSGVNATAVHYTSLIAQLVPDIRPEPIQAWSENPSDGDAEQVQICRIVETARGAPAVAEGLFFQLIVRLHKYSLGRANHADSVQWQRGLVLEDDYGARALLEHVANDVRITVRSPYPERFLAALTYEVKWLVENFWAGLRCDVMVPCLNSEPCIGLFEVQKLIENKKRKRPEQPCNVCNEWQNVELLLHNAPASRPNPLSELLENPADVMAILRDVRQQMQQQQARHDVVLGRFDKLDSSSRELISRVEDAYVGVMRTLLDEAKDGPRLFSFEPVEPGFFERPKWISEKFRLTLWCEHSRLPLPALDGYGSGRGVYELNVPRDWLVKAAPLLKLLTSTLGLVVPVAAAAVKVAVDEVAFKTIEKQLDLGQKAVQSVLKGGEAVGSWLAHSDDADLEYSEAKQAQGSVLRQLHAWLKEKDPAFGGLVRVQNKRQEFLWVHSQFEKEY
jgi:hypothetical protein